MIKIDRYTTCKVEEAILSLQKAKVHDSGYNTEEVNLALKQIFYNKCYICENKEATSYQIEHLIPHGGNLELKYDWKNLFWACGHCNNTKLSRYYPILDCTIYDVDKLIAFRKEGYFGTEERLVFLPLNDDECVLNTVQLLNDVYYGTTPQKQIEAKIIRKKLRGELSKFKEYVREYQEADDGEEKDDMLFLIKREIKASSPFAAFKRWLIIDNKSNYPKLAELLQIV